MENSLVVALAVTGIGMLVLFLALALLYGMMYGMTALIQERPKAGDGERGSMGVGEKEAAEEDGAMQRRAAAIAVALARAECELCTSGLPGAEESTGPRAPSAWWAMHHSRQLAPHLPTRRVR
jgi:Na+-transporting methylmalonyl-CoA/oxaloacetate decarboxylase gamma subunit